MKTYKEKANRYFKYVTKAFSSGNAGSILGYHQRTRDGWFGAYYTCINPTVLKSVNITIGWTDPGSFEHGLVCNLQVQGSNDNSTWTSIKNWGDRSGRGTSHVLDCSENTASYKYLRFYAENGGWNCNDTCDVASIEYVGTETIIQEVTAEDEYDFIVEGVKTYVVKEENVRKYYKYEYSDWIQPILSSNGTIGGSSFAVSALNTDSRTQPYYAFDSNLSDTFTAGWLSKVSNNYLEWYNPKPLNISQLQIQYQTTNTSSVGYISSWVIKASSNGENFIDILSGTTGNYGITNISIEHSGYYKYWRFYPINWSSEWYDIINMQIAATEQSIVGGTADDYDFYEYADVYKAIKS